MLAGLGVSRRVDVLPSACFCWTPTALWRWCVSMDLDVQLDYICLRLWWRMTSALNISSSLFIPRVSFILSVVESFVAPLDLDYSDYLMFAVWLASLDFSWWRTGKQSSANKANSQRCKMKHVFKFKCWTIYLFSVYEEPFLVYLTLSLRIYSTNYTRRNETEVDFCATSFSFIPQLMCVFRLCDSVRVAYWPLRSSEGLSN